MIDAHCHLDFEAFDDDREAVIERASAAGIEHIVIPGVKSEHWNRIAELCEQPNLHACYGLHPYHVNQHKNIDLLKLDQQLSTQDCVALGECGLDYREGQAEKPLQLKFFTAQLGIAQEHNKPVVIHSVHATEDVIQLLKKYPELTGMIHSYSGSIEQARQLIDMGFYISLGGSITYPQATKARKVAAAIKLDGLLLETDSPDQPDAAHKNQRNEPAFLSNVLACLAEIRTESATEIARQTTMNAQSLFGIQITDRH
jgi:TatD DNase family protein